MTKTSKTTKNLVVVGLFAAMCYVLLYLKIPVPAPVGTPFLHLGNMVVILAAMLFSGTIGGLSGSIGMGLHDLFNGYADSALKTVVLKFGIGFFVGLVAAKGRREGAKRPTAALAISGGAFVALGAALLIVTQVLGYEILVPGAKKALTIIPALYIFCLILGAALLLSTVFIKRFSVELSYCMVGAVAGILFNLVGEFFFGAVRMLIMGSAFTPALISAAVSLPATLINGSFSIIGAVMLYIPLSKALKRAHLI